MPREVIEYRAVGVDYFEDGRESRDECGWHCNRAHAEADLERMLSAPLPYDELYIERRGTVYWEPERVKEDGDV